ncbi:MAG: hypothetical protein D5R99_09600 [Methanocalculus sp. MSAO_Arc1]|uniref:hypothetical protein n=1 Tax=Methanocalculus TaxID=71151 RepID=UPI000FF839A2|nr:MULTISPECIES: hypothetical protein [unclassified Methanocalculus]MCP1662743.1 hypothetical protein [Methanocalculus sp. AMF5]RQD78896.1 MAG: hypothetical protein D5R99_09600 [Methanocalculus sp. MSAO_Arc1]
MKRIILQATALLSGLLLIGISAGVYLGMLTTAVGAVLSILVFPVFLIPIGLLLASELTDGDIPFMGY